MHGELVTNSNQPLFLEFVQYSGLVILNSKFCKGVPTYEIVNKKRSIIDLGLTNSPETVLDFVIEPKPFGVNSQTCHRALTITIRICPPEKVPITAPRRNYFFKHTTIVDQKCLAETVSQRIMASESSMSPDYFLLAKIFTLAKKTIQGKRNIRTKTNALSPATLTLQRMFSDAIVTMQEKKTEFSYFVVDNLEKLLNLQYDHEEKARISEWIQNMNGFDFSNRTRLFFSELRKRHNVTHKAGPIFDSLGTLSKNFNETLKNWIEYYKNLYFCSEPTVKFPTPGENEFLDKDLELSEFMQELYSQKVINPVFMMA